MWHHEFPEFAIETIRLRTFDDWPKIMKQKPEAMSDAGFFYTQISDRVLCFSCGGGICKWEENDDPWEQHAIWYSKCEYLLLVKGPEYVATTIKKFGPVQNGNEPSASSQLNYEHAKSNSNDNSSQSSTDKAQNDNAKTNDTRLCRICYVNEYNTIFLPCSHIVACTRCAAAQNKCPICRKKFESVNRIFMP